MSKLDDAAEILSGPIGYLVVGAVVVTAIYCVIEGIPAWLEGIFTQPIANTAAPISTLGGSYTGADNSTTAPDGTDLLSVISFGNLGS